MDSFSLSHFAERFMGLRRWGRTNLPDSDSNVAFDILLFALSRSPSGGAEMKDFYLSLNYSKDRVSELVRELVADGWLEIRQPDDDRRVRVVCATSQLQDVFLSYATSLSSVVDSKVSGRHTMQTADVDVDAV
jgi:hypothetical protein